MTKQTPQALTAAIYARYSSSNQNDASIEQQVAECTAYAAANGLTVLRTYEDRAMTGRNDKRPGFQRMIRAAEHHEFGVLLAYKSNRLARNMLDALRYEDRLGKAGVRVVYCKEDFGDNAAGRMALRMMMSLNQFYSENLSEDVKRGMADTARQGKIVGAIPYGYKRGPDGGYAIDEPAAAIVREIYQRVLNGEQFTALARDLNARGICTAHGRRWTKSSFHAIVDNERYTGVLLFSDIRIEGGMPQIITREMFDAVQQVRKQRNAFTGRHRSNNDFILTGKLYCGHCLSPMVGISGTGKSGTTHYYYSCNGKRVQKICNKRNVRKDVIEEEVARAIITTVLDNDTLEWIADTIMETAKRMEEQSKLGYYQDRLKAVQKQIDNIVRAVELGVVAEEINSRLTQLRADKQTIQGKIAAEKMNLLQVDREHVVYYLEQLRDGNPSDPKFQKRLVRDFVRAVYVYDDHFKLVVDFTGRNATFNVPMPPGNDSCDSYDSCDTSLYRESNPPPYHPYTNPRHGSVTAAGQGFVIAWYFER